MQGVAPPVNDLADEALEIPRGVTHLRNVRRETNRLLLLSNSVDRIVVTFIGDAGCRTPPANPD
jgi:hypothetical protein